MHIGTCMLCIGTCMLCIMPTDFQPGTHLFSIGVLYLAQSCSIRREWVEREGNSYISGRDY